MSQPDPFDADVWCSLPLSARRSALASAIAADLVACQGVLSVSIDLGTVERPYDLTAVVETDVGRLRTPLWSHARAALFCDESIHPANRQQHGPAKAAHEAAERLRRRLAVKYQLESGGLTVTMSPEVGVERTWTAEHSTFRKRTAVVREDRVRSAGDLDIRNLFAHFYTGPSLRLISDSGEPFLLPEASEAEGALITLCHACSRWSDGSQSRCPGCGGDRVDTVIAARPSRR
jgi:hypothetical protein